MLNLIVNIISWVLIVLILCGSMWLDKPSYQKPSILAIILIAFLIAIATVLSSLIGYNLTIFSRVIKLSLGSFIIFVAGMLFGPFLGTIAAIASDNLGLLINSQDGYSAIFAFESVLYAVLGSLVLFRSRNNYWWIFRLVSYYAICFIVSSFLLDTLWIWIVFGSQLTKVIFVTKLIKAPIEIVIYTVLTFIFFTILHLLIARKYSDQIWSQRWPYKLINNQWFRRFGNYN